MMMPVNLIVFLFLCLPNISMAESTQRYVVPPTLTTTSYVPTISDAAMEECVRVYNEAERISEKLETSYVDNYNEDSVNAYNRMVVQHQNKQAFFNENCAGKGSYSACKAAQKLNEEQGLPYQKCVVDN